jgi:hypothetical protein
VALIGGVVLHWAGTIGMARPQAGMTWQHYAAMGGHSRCGMCVYTFLNVNPVVNMLRAHALNVITHLSLSV